MTPRERIQAAVNGQTVDRVPYFAWRHFYLEPPAGPGSGMSEAELQFFDSFQPDLLKVMHDVPYEPIGTIETPSDWRKIKVIDPNDGNFGKQLFTLQQIRRGLHDDVPMIDTVFGVYHYAHELSHGRLLAHLRQDPESVKVGLSALTESIRRYAEATIELGCEGIYYALAGASHEGATRQEYESTFKELDKTILHSVGKAPFNVLHLHGYDDLYFDLVHDLPASIVGWSDRAGGPTLADGRHIHNGCIMGGIDEKRFSELTPQQIVNLGRAAIAEAGRRWFILAPGCSVPENSTPEQLLALRTAACLA